MKNMANHEIVIKIQLEICYFKIFRRFSFFELMSLDERWRDDKYF